MKVLTLETDQIVTAVARLLALARTYPETDKTHKALIHCAAEFTTLLDVDPARTMTRASEMLSDAHRNAVAAYN